MAGADLDAVMAIENVIYTHPWTRGNFADSLSAGSACWVMELQGVMVGYAVLGFFLVLSLAMALVQALEMAEKVGYPVILKASAGGGGRGMRVARDAAELSKSFAICAQEAQAAFGDGSIYLEKYLSATHHVEVQIAVDSDGTALHFGERDCSLQRRHQKLVEESPSTALTPRVREEFLARAAKAVGAAGYRNVGTLEFLVGPDGKPYFIEINCRIQVEHPVTEVVTGVDLVALQIALAGSKMSSPACSLRKFYVGALKLCRKASSAVLDWLRHFCMIQKF